MGSRVLAASAPGSILAVFRHVCSGESALVSQGRIVPVRAVPEAGAHSVHKVSSHVLLVRRLEN